MSKELSPKYNPAEVEAGRYQKWPTLMFSSLQEIKRLSLTDRNLPPNVTGKLQLVTLGIQLCKILSPRSKTHARFDTLCFQDGPRWDCDSLRSAGVARALVVMTSVVKNSHRQSSGMKETNMPLPSRNTQDF